MFRPGQYEVGGDINTVKSLLQAAEGVTEEAFTARAVMHRLKADRTLEVVSVDVEGILTGRAADIPLQNGDILFIPTRTDMQEERTLTIDGEVQYPGIYQYADNETLEDFILQAGGLTMKASTVRVDVSRRIINPRALETDSVLAQTYTFALTEAQFAALSNGQHTMQVKVTDTLGNSATRTTTFTRSVAGIEYIVGPIETDAAAEKILVSLQYYAAEEDVTVSVSNNAFDENPTWELATIGLKHIFSNSTKTAATWGIGVKVQINKSAGYETISSRPVSGSYI